MKKIYLTSLTVLFAIAVNAQTTLKFKRGANQQEFVGSTIINKSGGQTPTPAQIAASITCSNQYTAGVAQSLNLTLKLTNTGNEYGDSLSITLPAGFTVTSAFPNDSIGVSEAPTTALSGCPTTASGTKEPFRGVFGQNVVWGNNDNCYGGMPSGTNPGSTMTITLNVTIGSGVTGPQTVNFFVSGDGFGTGPGNYNGSFVLNPAGTPVIDMITKFVIPTGVTQINNCALGTQTIIARVVNMSTVPQSSITAKYSVNGVITSSLVIPGPIAVGDSATISFPIAYNFNTSNLFNIKAWVSQPSDVSLANDTAALAISNSISVPLMSTNYVNGIESAYDYGSINKTWIGAGTSFGFSNGTVHTGTVALFYTISAGAPTNTYVAMNILPCTDVVNGDTYKISFWVKSNTSGTLTVNGQYGVAAGLAQTSASMTTILMPNKTIVPNAQAGTWTKDSVNFVATASETRYFALIGGGTITNTVSSQINVRFDDIKITKIAGASSIKTNLLNDLISLYPNPTSGILNISNLETISNLELFNVIGEKVLVSTLSKGTNSIDLSDLSNGSYFIKLTSNNQSITKKIILNK